VLDSFANSSWKFGCSHRSSYAYWTLELQKNIFKSIRSDFKRTYVHLCFEQTASNKYASFFRRALNLISTLEDKIAGNDLLVYGLHCHLKLFFLIAAGDENGSNIVSSLYHRAGSEHAGLCALAF